MAIISLKEITESREADVSVNGTFIVKTHKRYFMVVTDDVNTSVKAILDQTDAPSANNILPGENTTIPNIGDIHPDYINETDESELPKCNNISVSTKEEDFRLVLIFTCTYTTDYDNTLPWDKPEDVQFGLKSYERVADKAYRIESETIGDETFEVDKQFNPNVTIENSAKHGFDPPQMLEENNSVILINKKYRQDQFDPLDVRKFKDTVNINNIKIAGVDIAYLTGRLTKIEPKLEKWVGPADDSGTPIETNNVILYWDVDITIEIQEKEWTLKPLDQGYKDINDQGYKAEGANADLQYKFKDDGSGEFRDATGQLKPAKELVFDIYFPCDWKTLDLPEDLPLAKDFPQV